jgi:hypothetical protein
MAGLGPDIHKALKPRFTVSTTINCISVGQFGVYNVRVVHCLLHQRILTAHCYNAVLSCRELQTEHYPEKEKTVSGTDALQALVVPLQMIGSEIYTSNCQMAGGVTYAGLNGCGFPVAPTLRHLLTQDHAKYLYANIALCS